MSELPKEKDVEMALRKHLKEHGYTVREKAGIRWVDIVASKNGKNYYVGVEGNTNRRGNPMTSSQKYTHLLWAVGQICFRMNDDPEGIYELVLAEDEYYRKKIAELQTSLKKLDVETYFLDSKGNITH